MKKESPTKKLNDLLQNPPNKDLIKSNNGLMYIPIDKVEFMSNFIVETVKQIERNLIKRSIIHK